MMVLVVNSNTRNTSSSAVSQHARLEGQISAERTQQSYQVGSPSPTFSRVLDSEAFCPFGVDG